MNLYVGFKESMKVTNSPYAKDGKKLSFWNVVA